MEVSFQIAYRTRWGEDVRVIFPDGRQFPLHTRDGEQWQGSLKFDLLHAPSEIVYRYAVCRDGACVRKEWNGVRRRLTMNPAYARILLRDAWRDRPEDSCFYSAAFSGKGETHYPTGTETNHGKSILLKVRCPRLRHKSWRLAVSGNQACLGGWDMTRPAMMTPCGANEWCILLDAAEITFPFEYKFLAWDAGNGKEGEWMTGDNRLLDAPPLAPGDLLVVSDDEVHFPLPQWKIAGTAVPLFSLRSTSSFGVGDLGDLRKFIDWLALTGQKIVQLLPINDTTLTHTWTDSYPYNAISIYAFHPMYIDLNRLDDLEDGLLREKFARQRVRLNALPKFDYEAVNRIKLEYLRLLFKQEGIMTLHTAEYRRFFDGNRDWLQPYAAFCYLRDLYGTPRFGSWPEHRQYDAHAIARLYESDPECRQTMEFHYYLQFILHTQLVGVSEYARKRHVLLKGDIPIGISPNSVEAWTEPHYFNLNGQAGAPPDPFAAKGQNWGFPTYNWDAMEKDGYAWWKHRLKKMAEYFDAYRIDHILGFFRIWEIPSHSVEGLLGQFVPSLPMTPEEIGSFGLPFRKERFTKPYITDEILDRQFGELADCARRQFLFPVTPRKYALLPEYDTQRKVEAYFAGKDDAESQRLRAGLYALINNVLFVPDRAKPDSYHPRIAVQDEPVYDALAPSEKEAFNRLYDHYYYERHNRFWEEEAMRKLPELTDSTRMLVCGEDLGMIPGCVKGVINALRILSLEIQRMPKDPAQEFGNPAHYPYRSVCAISTHDMTTLRGWWQEDYNLTCNYYYHYLGGKGDCPREASGTLCDTIVLDHLRGNSMLCILSLQDWLSINEAVRYPDVDAERINIPARPHHKWRYRMHLTIEELMRTSALNDRIREMIQESGRATE